jgi:hypothetical protein
MVFSTLPVVTGPVEIAAMLPSAAAKLIKAVAAALPASVFAASAVQGDPGDDPIFPLRGERHG